MVLSKKYVYTSGTLYAHVIQNEFLSEISPNLKIIDFSVCLMCADHVPDVRTYLYCLQLENTHLGGSNAPSHVFLRQKLASLAISKVLAPTRGGVLIKQDSVTSTLFGNLLVHVLVFCF